MKVDYNAIIESYEQSYQEFLNDYMEITTEAETLNTTSNNSTYNQVQGNTTQTVDTTDTSTKLDPSSKQKQNLIQKIQKIIKTIIEKIQMASIKIMNRIRLMLETDKGFFKTLYSRRAAVKPLQNFKAITYNYNDQYLDPLIKNMQKIAITSIKQLSNLTGNPTDEKVKQICNADPKSVSNVFLSFFTQDKSDNGGPDTTSFTREMIDRYRQEKKESMHNQSEIPMLMQQAKSSEKLKNTCNNLLRECKNSINTIKAIEAKARAVNTTEALGDLTQRVNKSTMLYNTYLAVLRMYFELKLERSLSARLLLKKFYQF